MTKNIVQHFVENLLKVLKVLKTRTALIMNGLSELHMRSARKGAKAPFKTKEQKQVTNLLQEIKAIEKAIDKRYNKVRKIESEKKGRYSK